VEPVGAKGGGVYFTKFLKGIPESSGLDEQQAEAMLLGGGLICNWWRNAPGGVISPVEVGDKLTEANLYWHLEHYGDPKLPSPNPFGEETPFISTTAGVVERDHFFTRNLVYPAFLTALLFATDGLRRPGYVFYGYLITLGRKAVPFQEYAEEVRELNTYTSYLRFHEEGELVAKVHIPSHRLERLERWEPGAVVSQLEGEPEPSPSLPYSKVNPRYSPPEQYSNIRDVLL
jgi:hypothetical protein